MRRRSVRRRREGVAVEGFVGARRRRRRRGDSCQKAGRRAGRRAVPCVLRSAARGGDRPVVVSLLINHVCQSIFASGIRREDFSPPTGDQLSKRVQNGVLDNFS